VRWNVRFPNPIALVVLVALLWPAVASAQVGYPRPYPYGYRFAEPESDLQFAVRPKEATVYVDGYFAGVVDDFDGVFQRLHVTPGEHEITLYLQGYRSIQRKLYLSPNSKRKITETMEKLGSGEVNDPTPVPAERPLADNQPPQPRDPFPNRGRVPPPAPRGSRPPAPLPPQTGQESSSRTGSLVIRVQPSDADVMIDGEHWRGPSGDDRLVVQVSEGRHRVEVQKDGYTRFTTEVEVRRNDSLPINVSLAREK
jgi:hypothetical protein